MGRAGVAQEPLVQRLVGGQVLVGGGYPLIEDFAVHGILGDAYAQADAVAHSPQVLRVPVVVVVDVRLNLWVSGLEGQLALSHGQLKAGVHADVVGVVVDFHLCRTVLAGHQHGLELHIVAQRRVCGGVAHSNLGHRSLHVGSFALRPVQHRRRWVVAQVLAHALSIMHHADTETLQVLRGADAGEHQQLRRCHRAGTEDDLIALDGERLAAAFGLHSHRFLAVEQDPVGGHAATNCQVQAVSCRVQIVEGVAHPHALNGVAGPGRHAGRFRVVLVLVDRVALSNAGLLEGRGVGHPFGAGIAANGDRAVVAVNVASPKIEVSLHLVEVGQALGKAPLVVAPLGPAVIVLGNATQQHLAVDGAGAAGGPAPGNLQVGHFVGHVAPVGPAVGPIRRQEHVVAQLDIVGQMVDRRIVRTGLEQQHRYIRIL